MKKTEVKARHGFTALSNEELEMVDGGKSLNKYLGIPEKMSEDSHDGVSIGPRGVTIHDNDVDVHFSGQLNPPEAKITITIRI